MFSSCLVDPGFFFRGGMPSLLIWVKLMWGFVLLFFESSSFFFLFVLPWDQLLLSEFFFILLLFNKLFQWIDSTVGDQRKIKPPFFFLNNNIHLNRFIDIIVTFGINNHQALKTTDTIYTILAKLIYVNQWWL